MEEVVYKERQLGGARFYWTHCQWPCCRLIFGRCL